LNADDKEFILGMQQKMLLTCLFADPDNLSVPLLRAAIAVSSGL
jgi:hypothetical protein